MGLKRKIGVVFFFMLGIIMPILAQCPLMVDAGEDQILCFPGGQIQLEGQIDGSYVGFEWSPPNGLNSTTILNPTATVNNTITYTLTAYAISGVNEIQNGDFEQGNQGFTTVYTYSPPGSGVIYAEGTYTISDNPNNEHSGFSACPDHTTGSGQMLVVNGAATPNETVWCQTVNVTPGVDYEFSYWLTSVNPASPANLQVTIDGVPIGTCNASSALCSWQQCNYTWNSGGSAVANICIVNLNTAAGGNDFAIDDIELIGVCEVEDQVTIEISNIQAIINPPLNITCDMPIVTLNGSVTPFSPSLTYNWTTTNGNILSGADTPFPEVDAPGQYTLEVTNEYGCTTTATITVTGDTEPPNVQAVGEDLDCLTSEAVLGVQTNSQGGIFIWQGPNGFGSIQPNPIVTEPGTYFVTVTDINGCSNTDSVLVEDLSIIPDLMATGGIISCQSPEIEVIANSSDDNPSFSWTGPNGFSSTDDNPIVNETGDYTVTVFLDGGCERDTTVSVTGDLQPPDIALTGDSLNCTNDTIILVVSSNEADLSYQWDGPMGMSSNSDSLQTGLSGMYLLTAIDTAGCVREDSVFVPIDTLFPSLNLSADTIDCATDSLQLDLQDIGTGNNYSWVGPAGFQSNAGSPWVYQSGTYTVAVTGQNGCVTTDSVVVPADVDLPVVDIVSDTVTCNTDTLQITASSTGTNPGFSWSGPGGFMESTAVIEVTQNGTYTLTVTDANGCEVTTPYTLPTDLVTPSLNLSADTITCNQPTATLEVSSPTNLETTNWIGPGGFTDINATSQASQAGLYVVTASGENGCVSTDSILVEADTVGPVLQLTGDTLFCNTDSIELSPQGSEPLSDPQWIGPGGFTANTTNAWVSNAGMYTFSAAGENGCRSEVTTEVLQDEQLPTLTLGADTITCYDPSIQIDLSSDISLTTVSWTGPNGYSDTGQTPLVSEAGLYTAQVETVDGCQTVATVTVSEDLNPPSIGVQPADTITCDAPQVDLEGMSQSPLDSVLWLGPNGYSSGQLMTQTGQAGTYQLIGWGTNGCRDTISLEVVEATDRPDLMLSAGRITCFDQLVPLEVTSTTPGLTYNWIGPGNYSSTNNANMVDQSGWYVLEVNAPNGCTVIDSIEVSEDTQSPQLMLVGGELGCSVDSVQLMLSSNAADIDILWSTGSVQVTPWVSQDGWYTVEVTDRDNGCTTMDSVEVTIADDSPQGVSLDVRSQGCASTFGQLELIEVMGGTGPYQYILEGRDTVDVGVIQGGLQAGDYDLEVLDAEGCRYRTMITVPVYDTLGIALDSLLEVKLGESGQIEVLTNLPANRIEEVIWWPTDYLSCGDCLTPVVTPERSLRYWVTVIDDRGCVQEGTVFVLLNFDDPIYIPNVFSPTNEDGINDRFTIYAGEGVVETINYLNIYNRWGELIWRREAFDVNEEQLGWDGRFRGEFMNPGVFVYMAEVVLRNGEFRLLRGDLTLID